MRRNWVQGWLWRHLLLSVQKAFLFTAKVLKYRECHTASISTQDFPLPTNSQPASFFPSQLWCSGESQPLILNGTHVTRQWDQCKGKQVYFFLLVMTLFWWMLQRCLHSLKNLHSHTSSAAVNSINCRANHSRCEATFFFLNVFFIWPLLNHRWAICRISVITHEHRVSFCFVAYSCNKWTLHKKTD